MVCRYTYLFGPVPSRRLGRSLGVDLIPFKTCTMDCVYCQLGETTCEVSERGEYVPLQDVLAELEQWKASAGEADHITLAGSGEPTLHIHFGDVFRWVKENTRVPSVLLTNGSLLHHADVREAAALADKVKVTLSAWDEASFQRIHRPALGVRFEQLVEGERLFRRIYPGELSVEVFIIEGINSLPEQCRRIAGLVHTLEPDHIDINTVVRPPAVEGVSAPPESCLQVLAELFGEKASLTVTQTKRRSASMELSEAAVTDLIRRHPATCRQLAEEYNLPEDEVAGTLAVMVGKGVLLTEQRGSETYYMCRIRQ